MARGARKLDIVRHGGASVILSVLKRNRILLIRQARPAVGRVIWELPAGTIGRGESPLACARRELAEETGWRAGRIKHLISFFPSPGFCDEKMHVFVATQLSFVGQRLEPDEELTVRTVTLKQVLDMIQKGLIHDAKTIVALLVWQLNRKKHGRDS